MAGEERALFWGVNDHFEVSTTNDQLAHLHKLHMSSSVNGDCDMTKEQLRLIHSPATT